jgi:hypothetical protein
MSGRSGWASSPALRPACACDRAGTSRSGAPRCSHETAPATPHRGTPARCPHPQARWLRRPAERFSAPPSRLSSGLLGRCDQCLWEGGIHSAWRVGRPLSPEATGSPACGSGVGCRGRGCLRTPRGPAPGRTAGSWPPESRRAASGGEHAPSRRPTRRAKEQPHAVKKNKLEPERLLMARGAKKKASTQWKRRRRRPTGRAREPGVTQRQITGFGWEHPDTLRR